ncbi:hypothetical protein Dsin_017056 [Dipteronia sinensis]|uniref:pyruvate decarboxylase n=1 Tax=Dipteronia sinensis TaxID=43782 RepID=A0AAE0AFP7_9ROSI|nr:hypothetical protein Dsin_017056 [Dipteronia sinensis]
MNNVGMRIKCCMLRLGGQLEQHLGYAQVAPDKRVIACVGDGSFQMAAQEVSTMIRCGHKSIIFLINNGGYTAEVESHDGPYNVIKNWDYAALIDAIQNEQGKPQMLDVQGSL